MIHHERYDEVDWYHIENDVGKNLSILLPSN